MQNNREEDPPKEVKKLIEDENIIHLNAIINNDNHIELAALKQDHYFNPKQLDKRDNEYNSSESGYEHSDKSMDGDIDYNNNDESIAILTASPTTIEPAITTDSPLAKCCEAFWNIFKYISIFLSLFWMLFLFIILIQPSMHNIRLMIAYIDPIAGKNHPISHRINSKETCSIYDINQLAQEFNVYLLFHFARWFVYSLIYRNRLILWINSILWELIQFFIASLTVFNLQWIGQCWYSSIIFDILLMNMLGIELGLIVMKKSEVCLLYNRFKEIFQCKISFFKAFITMWCIIILFQLQQLLMFIIFDQTFWYTTNGWMIWCRLMIYSLCSLYCVNQLYHWMKSNTYNGLKSLSWVIVLNFLVLSELLIAIKTYGSQY